MYRMLIVDDEERIVNSIYALMEERFDFELHRCTSSLQALAEARRMRVDMIIADVTMPQMNGLELLAEVRKIWPKCHFLILTAYQNFEFAYQALKYDRVDYLLKVESYDAICEVVAKKREQIEKERLQEERLQDYDRNLHRLNESMRGYFLKRMIVMGTPLPDQSDLDEIALPLRLTEAGFLVLAATESRSAVEHGRVAAAVDQWVNAQLEQYQMQSFSYTSAAAQIIIFAIQARAGASFSQDELTVYIHTVFDNLTQIVEAQMGGVRMAVCCADRFIPWAQMHALYQRSMIHLKDIRSDSGMKIVMVDEELNRQYTGSCFPNIDEIGLLWELIKNGNLSGFRAAMEQGLGEFCSNQSMHSLCMHPSVTAISYLLTETAKLYAPELMQTETFRKLVYSVGKYESARQWLEDVFATVERILSSNETSRENKGTWLVEMVNQYIEQHYAEDITLTALASQMHYSPSYLSRYYKAHAGVNVMNYLSNVRILKAQELLTATNLRIGEVAEQTGFGSSKYFSRVFRESTGVMPAQYRNTLGRAPKG